MELKKDKSPIQSLFYSIKDDILSDIFLCDEIKEVYFYNIDENNINCIMLDIKCNKIENSTITQNLYYKIYIMIFVEKYLLEYYHDIMHRIQCKFLLSPPKIFGYDTISCLLDNIENKTISSKLYNICMSLDLILRRN